MLPDLGNGRGLVIRLDETLDEVVNPALFGRYWHKPSSSSNFHPVTENKFSLTTENRANILEHMRRDVKRFLSHRGFSPVINVAPPHVIRGQSDGLGWWPI